jgi:hypothetical protein
VFVPASVSVPLPERVSAPLPQSLEQTLAHSTVLPYRMDNEPVPLKD